VTDTTPASQKRLSLWSVFRVPAGVGVLSTIGYAFTRAIYVARVLKTWPLATKV